MRSSRNWTARVAAALTAAALLTLSAAPAYAEGESGPPSPSPSTASPEPGDKTEADVSVTVASGEATEDSWSKFVRLTVENDGPDTAKNVIVTVTVPDFTDAKKQIGIVDRKRCTGSTSGDDIVFTCVLGDLRSGGTDNGVIFDFWHGDAPVGAVAEGTVSVTSDTTDPAEKNNTAPFTLSVTPAGVDVSIWAAGELTLKPGETASFSGADFLHIDNESDTKVDGLGFSLSLPAYASFEPDFADCTYSADGRKMNCSPDVELPPGSGLGRLVPFTDKSPLRITAAADAPGPITLGRGNATVTPGTLRDLGESGTKKTSGSREKAAPGKGDDSVEFSLFTTDNPVDLSIKAAGASGRVGDTLSVDLTVTNTGKVTAPGVTITFTAPEGTTITGGPSDCAEKTKGKVWACASTAWVAPGKTGSGTFKLRLDSKDVKDGSATVESGVKDSNPADNTVAVTVTIGGGLPITGTSLVIAGIVAAVLLVAGAALILFTRKRRTTEETAAGDDSSGPDADPTDDPDADPDSTSGKDPDA